MNNIAFRRAKDSRFKGYFHDDFIVEFREDPDNVYAASGEWEILAEDDFKRELEKAPELHIIFCEKQKQMADSREKSEHDAEIMKLQLTKEERLELIKLRKYKKFTMKVKR